MLLNYLLENGYKKITEKEINPEDKNATHHITAMGSLHHYYYNKDFVFIYGLSEYGKPPTILSSNDVFYIRPYVLKYFKNKRFISYNWLNLFDLSRTDEFNKIDSMIDSKKLYNLLINNKYELVKCDVKK